MALLTTLLKAKRGLFSVLPLMRDTRVPLALKLITGAIAVVIVSPVDLLGDIPILGVLDDGVLLTLLCMWFAGQAGKHLIAAQPEPVAVPMRKVN